MELIIHSPSEDGFLKTIEFNHEEIKQELSIRLEKYKGLVYSDEEIKLAKADRVTLNKFKEAIETKRKEIKAQCLRPYEEFEIKVKEILALVDKPIQEIDSQVKAFENKQKEEKREEIKKLFGEAVGDLKDILPLNNVWNEKWLNSTYKLATISSEITSIVERVKTDLKHIEDLKSEYEVQMKDRYLETGLLSESLALKTKLEEQKKKLDEYKRQQEEKASVQEPTVTQEVSRQQEPESRTEQTTFETLDFRVIVTPEQKQRLRGFLLSNKIKCVKAPIEALKKFIIDLRPYCDTCANECGSSACDECHRKYFSWRFNTDILETIIGGK